VILARAVLPHPYPLPLGEGEGEGRTSILSHASISLIALLFLLVHATFLDALDVPPLKGRVNDYASLMPPAHAQALEQRLAEFESQTGHQIAVLTIPSLQGDALESFTIRVAESWKIGKKGFDNGVILFIAQNDRKLRIEVGYGLEGVLPDAIASRIIREVIVPRFRDGDFAGGVENGVEAIMKVTSGEPLPVTAGATKRRSNSSPPFGAFIILLLLALVLFAALAPLSMFKRAGGWSTRGRRTYGGWSEAGSGGGDFGGGGFSGGGGGFGGGGASGSW